MGAALDILRNNETILYFYFVYGLASFTLGLGIALQSRESRKRSRLAVAGHLNWLAGFGITHAFNEWANVFIPIQATYLSPDTITLLRVVQIALLALSYLLLFQFGILAAAVPHPWRRLLRLLPLVMIVIWLIVFLSGGVGADALRLARAEVWTRRLLAFPGALLAGWGMLRQADTVESFPLHRIARHFRQAAVLLGVYAILAGLVVPAEDVLAAQWPGHLTVVDLLGIPIPVLRSIAALGIAVSIIMGLGVFEVETTRQLEDAKRQRLEAAERARLALDTIANTVSRRMDLGKLLDAALATVVEVTQSTAGWVMLTDDGGEQLTLHASWGPVGCPSTGLSCTARQECVCARVRREDLVVSASGDACALWPVGTLPFGFTGVPLQSGDRVVGILCVGPPTGRGFNAEDLGLLTSIGRQIGLAVENARLLEELRRKEQIRSHLLQQVLTIQEEERRRVALELHDDTGQQLSAVVVELGAARSVLSRDVAQAADILDEAREIAAKALQSLRKMIVGLRPASLDDLGLLPAICQLADEVGQRAGVEIKVDGGALNRRLAPEVETALFRIVQEGLNNIARHAAASRATLRFELADDEVRALLKDDGVGFDPARVFRHPHGLSGLGLPGMQERANLLGGEVTIRSASGKGTRVTVRLPLDVKSQGPTVGGQIGQGQGSGG